MHSNHSDAAPGSSPAPAGPPAAAGSVRAPLLRRLYWIAVLLCLAARAAILIDTPPGEVYSRWSTVTDAGVYDRFGWNLAHDGVLGVGDRPSAFSLPAYPLLLASAYTVAGHRPGAARWIQALLGTLTVIFLGRLARRIGGDWAEIVAVSGGALYPYFLYFVREILTETLFLFAFSGMMLTAVRVGERGWRRDGLLHGAFAALGLMTRPVALALELGVLILARPWAREGRRRRLAGLALGALVVAAVWGGWVWRNWRVFGEPVALDTHGGFALYVGQLFSRGLPTEAVFEQVGYDHADIEHSRLPGGPRGELEADRRAGEAARKMIRDDPAAFFATLPRNLSELWLGMDFSDVAGKGGGAGLLVIAGLAAYAPLLLLGMAGLGSLASRKRWNCLAAAVALLLLTTAMHAAVLGGKRYRVATVDPILLVLGAGLVGGRLGREQSRLTEGGAAS